MRSGGRNSRSGSTRITILARGLHRARVDCWGSSPVHSFLLQVSMAVELKLSHSQFDTYVPGSHSWITGDR